MRAFSIIISNADDKALLDMIEGFPNSLRAINLANPDKQGWTPLNQAIQQYLFVHSDDKKNRLLNIIDTLLVNGADATIATKSGTTIYSYTSDADLAQLIQKHGLKAPRPLLKS